MKKWRAWDGEGELLYRSFVYDHYLEISEEQRALLEQMFFQGDEPAGVYTATYRIRAVLRFLATYRESPAKIPAGREFLEWFLKEGREGNAAYYATAAVLAYRAAGIPARYVEGYVLTEKQAEETDGNRVLLSTKNAHAWAEVYVDGLGFRAVEVTPGFYEEFYEADVIVAVPNEELEGAGEGTAGIQREEKLLFLYGQVTAMVGKLEPEFCPDHPLELEGGEALPFDLALYRRTVERMERLVYGRRGPQPGEIRAAEALVGQLRSALRKKRRGSH